MTGADAKAVHSGASAAAPPRYRTVSAYLRERYGGRVQRVALEAAFGCPHVDERTGRGGCAFCSESTFRPRGPAASPPPPVRTQLARGIDAAAERYGAAAFFAYFQRGTGTLAAADRLRSLYTDALSDPRVVGLSIGTRPDALPDVVLDLLAELASRHEVWVEVGLETGDDALLARMRRGHDVACYVRAAARVRARGLTLVPHVIFGLPGATIESDLATIRVVTEAGLDGIKIHNLYVMDDFELAEPWRAGRLPLASLAEHAALVATALERLPPSVVVHRIHGTGPREHLLGPSWALDTAAVHAAVDGELARRGTRQGTSWAAS